MPLVMLSTSENLGGCPGALLAWRESSVRAFLSSVKSELKGVSQRTLFLF
jgi:hypothetical protein